MTYKYVTWTAAIAVAMAVVPAHAAELSVNPDKNIEMKVSIYNQNLALIKDTRNVRIPGGETWMAFGGVARQMQPETALLKGDGVRVLEQNYEYDLLTGNNLLEAAIGTKVKTARVNPVNGDIILETAEVLNSEYNKPLLKTRYGVVADFPGWVAFETVPDNLRLKPTLVVKLDNGEEAAKSLTLNYLTNGLQWSANYVAEVTKDDQLDLQAWVTLNNQSGADYKNAEVQLIAGQVNQAVAPQPRPLMMKANYARGAAMEMDSAPSVVAENLAEYYIYTLPAKTDIMDQQSKQISLLSKPGVKYSKLYRMQSPLSLYWGNNDAEFEQVHPALVYKIVNNTESNLGEPLPSGVMRFYEKDNSGNLQFTGSADLNQLAKGESAKLAVGEAFDLYATGKVMNMQKLSDKMTESEVEVKFNNSKSTAQTIEFEQDFNGSIEVVSESQASTKVKARTLKWEVEVPAAGETTLTYKVRVVQI